MNVNHRHYILVICAILALVFTATGYIVLYRTVVSQARQSSQAQAEVTVETNKKLHEQDLMATFADTANNRSRLSTFVVSEEKIVDFIEYIEGIGTDSGTDLEMSSITTEKQNPKDPKTFGHIMAHINARGSWVNVMRALLLIENMPYSVSINNVKLVSIGDIASSASKKETIKSRQWELVLDIRVLTTK